MSQTPTVFHSSEVDDTAALAPGWYIGFVVGDVTLTTDGAIGPYETRDAARKAMLAGAWL